MQTMTHEQRALSDAALYDGMVMSMELLWLRVELVDGKHRASE